jgi:hypothetical protein
VYQKKGYMNTMEGSMSSSGRSRRSREGAPILRHPLTEEDRAMLARSLITGDLPDRALLARVEGPDAKDLVGRKDHGNYSGVEFPYVWPGEVGVRGSRIRRDESDTEFEYTEEGEIRKEKNKYVAAVGSRNLLYFFPETPVELLTDIEIPILIVEGEKKCLCAWRLAHHNSSKPRFLPIGLSGVWGWRGKIGTAETASGRHRSVLGPIPDLARIPFAGREVLIAFDSDAATNSSVQIARLVLAKELRRRGSTRVRYVIVPGRKDL